MKLKGYYKWIFNKLILWLRLSDLSHGISNDVVYQIIMDIFEMPELGISKKWKEEFREYSTTFNEPISFKYGKAENNEELAFSATNRIIMGQFVEEVYFDIIVFESDPGFKDRIREIVELDFKKFGFIK